MRPCCALWTHIGAYSSGQDVRKIPCLWPSLAFMKLWLLACARHGHLLAYYRVCGCVGLWARAIVNQRIPPGNPGISCFHYHVLHRHPPTNVLFVCDTNIILCLLLLKIFEQKFSSGCSENCKNYGMCFKILFIANLILLANTTAPDLA